MSFLAPTFLLLGLAAAVPLLLHLLRRRTGRTLEFPATRYLERAQQEHRRTLRLSNLLLMLLRVAAILAVTMAAARPVGRLLGSGHPPTAVAVVIDNSMSSGVVVDGMRTIDRLKRAAGELLSRTTPADRVWLVTADGVVRGGSKPVVQTAVQQVEPLSGAGDPREAMTRAAGIVTSSGVESRLVALLTDAQRSTWREAVALPGVRVAVFLPAGAPPVNRAVIDAAATPHRWTPRGTIQGRVLSPDSVPYLVSLGGRPIARGTAGGGDPIAVRVAPSERGWLAGTIEIAADELHADDARHFAVWIGAPVGVQTLASAGPFIADAVDALRASGGIAAGGDVRIGAPFDLPALPALIVAPADPVQLGASNRALERLGVPWRFSARVTTSAAARGAGIDGIRVMHRYPLVSTALTAVDTLATVDDQPWIVSGSRYVIIASPIIPDATELPVRAPFVPWLAATLGERLHRDPAIVLQSAPGARVDVPIDVDAMEIAAGDRAPVAGAFDAPAQSGVYFLLAGGRRVGALVVNPAAGESQLERLTESEVVSRFSADHTIVESTVPGWTAASFDTAGGRSFVYPMIAIALVVLLFESLVIILRERRGRG